MKRLLSLALMLSMGIFSTYAAEKNDSISENSNTSQTASINNSKFVVQAPKKEESTTSTMYGDLNGDNKVDIADVALYYQIIQNGSENIDQTKTTVIITNAYPNGSSVSISNFKKVKNIVLYQ